MNGVRVISAKVPDAVYKEMALRVPEGDRSDFIRQAIMEKLEKTPKADKLLQLEERMTKFENEIGQIRKYLADLELLTYQHGKVNPHTFAIDEIDHKIVDSCFANRLAVLPPGREKAN